MHDQITLLGGSRAEIWCGPLLAAHPQCIVTFKFSVAHSRVPTVLLLLRRQACSNSQIIKLQSEFLSFIIINQSFKCMELY